MGRGLKRFNQTSRNKQNIGDRETASEVRSRKPFYERTNLLKKDCIASHNGKNKIVDTSTIIEYHKERLSSEDVRKHLNECSITLWDISHNLPKETCKESKNNDMYAEVEKGQKRFGLRKRKRLDYSKMNRGASLLNEYEPIAHVPVYKQKIGEQTKKMKDVYEFDSDSEKRMKKRRKSTLNSSVPFEKEMKTIMRKIEAESNMQNAAKQCVRDDASFHDDGLDISDFDAAPLELEIYANNKSTSRNIANKVPVNRINIVQNMNLTRYSNDESSAEKGGANSTIDKSKYTDSQTNKKDPFDALFAQDNTETFDVETLSPIGKSTPWRPELQVKRNPFFLQYKETSLPSYNQDMVIDSTATEKIFGTNKALRNGTYSKTKQTSILSYVNGKSVTDSPGVIASSLYDIHELSPIKSVANSGKKSLKRSADKENKSLRIEDTPRKENRNHKVKRQILSEKVDNTENIAKNNLVKNLTTGQNSNEEMEVNYFGFNDSSDTSEHQLQKPKKSVWLFGKPMRLEEYLTVAKTSKDKVVYWNLKKNNDSARLDEEYLQKEDDNTTGEHELCSDLKLFEDLEPIHKNDVPKKYERIRKKRVRRQSIDLEAEDETEDQHPRKKRHDKRTKDEEREAEKWATKFNRMCEEVEEYPLEIE
ncbi:hypothetical protein Trydic_g1860 [Trypoxylus dichotomus]